MRAVATAGVLLGLVALAWVATILLRPGYPDPAAPDLVAAITAGELTEDQWAGLEAGAEAGDLLALNNLGAALVLQRQNTARAADLFRTAAFGPGDPDAPGRVQARYNLAFVLPGDAEADPTVVAEQLSALAANLEAGDPPSQALLADRLRDAGRQDYLTEDRQALQLRAIDAAAATGDADWRRMAADIGWQATGAPPSRVLAAALTYEELADGGSAEAALQLSDLLASAGPEALSLIGENGVETDPRRWARIAASMGLEAGACRYALDVFAGDLALARQGPAALRGALPAPETPPDPALDPGPLMLEGTAARPEGPGPDPDRLRALDWLADCAATGEAPAPPPDASFVSQEGAVYLGKARAAPADVGARPGEAALTLGAVLGYGLGGIPRDVPRAISVLTIARDRQGVAGAGALLSDLRAR